MLTNSKSYRIKRAAGLALGALVLLGACKPEEQNRVISFKPGIYMGMRDQTLSVEQRANIRGRMASQAGDSFGTSGFAYNSGDVRPPM